MQEAIIRRLGCISFLEAYARMLQFTRTRTTQTKDEIWFAEHPPVITLGKAADTKNILNPDGIDIIQTDRGGDAAYHGPGQILVYPLLDLKRRFGQPNIRKFVFKLEEAVIQTLAQYGIASERVSGAPGVYLPSPGSAKIAALGLKITAKGYAYHGLALNADMDLSSFQRINICGYPGLAVADMKTAGSVFDLEEVANTLIQALAKQLGLTLTEAAS